MSKNQEILLTESAVGFLKEEIGGSTEVIANPELSGDEANLTGLQVGNTKYVVPQGSGILVNVNEIGEQIVKNIKIGNVVYEMELPITEIPVGYSFNYDNFIEFIAFADEYTLSGKVVGFVLSLEADGGRSISAGFNKEQNSNIIDVSLGQNGEFIAKNDDLYLNIETDNIQTIADLINNASVRNYFETGSTLLNKIDVRYAKMYVNDNGNEENYFVSGRNGLYLFTS